MELYYLAFPTKSIQQAPPHISVFIIGSFHLKRHSVNVIVPLQCWLNVHALTWRFSCISRRCLYCGGIIFSSKIITFLSICCYLNIRENQLMATIYQHHLSVSRHVFCQLPHHILKPKSNFTLEEKSVSEWHVNGGMWVLWILGQEFNYTPIKDTWQQRDGCDKIRNVVLCINILVTDGNPDLISVAFAEWTLFSIIF